jgi:hypothetical protein
MIRIVLHSFPPGYSVSFSLSEPFCPGVNPNSDPNPLLLENDLLHFEWRWDKVSLEGLDSDIISPQLALLEESGLFRPTLSDLHELNLHQRQSASWWTALVNFDGNLVMLVFIGLVTFISVRLYQYQKSQRTNTIPQEE